MKLAAICMMLLTGCATHSIDNPEKINVDGIRLVIRENVIKEALPCYSKLIKSYENSGKSVEMLEGKLVIQFEVDKDGRASDIKIKESKIASPEVFESCIRQPMVKAQFPIPPSGQIAEITYPFIFSNKNKISIRNEK